MLRTISEISKTFGLSTRTLRYYEELGLLSSARREDYAYRVYSEEEVERLRRVLLLRALRIPLKQIAEILRDGDRERSVGLFAKSLGETLNSVERDIAALSVIRSLLADLLARLGAKPVAEKTFFAFVDSLSETLPVRLPESGPALKKREEKNMEELNLANERLSRMTDARIVYLPPATVAASHYIGENPEKNASAPLDAFVRSSDLVRKKPDLRHYGFNHPDPPPEGGEYGYEMWVTVPDDMEVPAPLVKKRFGGGLYAAHMIPMGAFEEWQLLVDWCLKHEVYEPNWGGRDCMSGLLEEHLNYANHVLLAESEPPDTQLDLLLPIKERRKE